MKRLVALSLGVLLLTAPVFAQAKAGEKAAAAPKAASAAGKVSAVTTDAVTVKGKDASWTFTVDKDTTVVAKGASHKVASLNADKKPTTITEFVSVGDEVTVSFHDMGATKHAAKVTVRTAPATKK